MRASCSLPLCGRAPCRSLLLRAYVRALCLSLCVRTRALSVFASMCASDSLSLLFSFSLTLFLSSFRSPFFFSLSPFYLFFSLPNLLSPLQIIPCQIMFGITNGSFSSKTLFQRYHLIEMWYLETDSNIIPSTGLLKTSHWYAKFLVNQWNKK